MLVEFDKLIDELTQRLEAVFDSTYFAHTGCEKPKIYKGIPATEPAHYIALDEVLDDLSVDGVATMGHCGFNFTVKVWLQTLNAKREKAATTVETYIDAVLSSVLAEPTFERIIERCTPSISVCGIAPDSSNRYLAACAIELKCYTSSTVNPEYLEVINGIHS